MVKSAYLKSSVVALMAMSMVGGCGIPEEQYNRDINALKSKLAAMQAARDGARKEFEASQAELRVCHGARDTCQRELAAMRNKGEKLDAGLRRALDRVGELERIAARQRAIFDKLRN